MNRVYCRSCGEQIEVLDRYCRYCGALQSPSSTSIFKERKNRIVAALFSFFLGSFGIHKFYLGEIGWGILYLLFFWTLIPGFIAFIEGILFLVMDEHKFDQKYNR